MKKRICIDPGHGGDQPGAVYHDLMEKDVNLAVAENVALSLMGMGEDLRIFMTRTFDRTLDLKERCKVANDWGVDCFVSIHCNADPDPDAPGMEEAKGEEIWYYDKSVNGLKLAKCLADEVDQIFPNEPFRGIRSTRPFIEKPPGEERSYLYVLAHTNAPAALVEIGFIDKSSSAETFTNELTLEKIGILIAKGTYEYLLK